MGWYPLPGYIAKVEVRTSGISFEIAASMHPSEKWSQMTTSAWFASINALVVSYPKPKPGISLAPALPPPYFPSLLPGFQAGMNMSMNTGNMSVTAGWLPRPANSLSVSKWGA